MHPEGMVLPNLGRAALADAWLLLDAARTPGAPRGMLAVGVKRSLTLDLPSADAFERIEQFVGAATGRCFGWVGYDQLRADPMLDLPSQDQPKVPMPTAHWVEPAGVLSFQNAGPEASWNWQVKPDDPVLAKEMVQAVIERPAAAVHRTASNGRDIHQGTPSSLDHEAYLKAFGRVHRHIQRGDIYELNLCRELRGDLPLAFDALRAFYALVSRTTAPYSAYIPFGGRRILSASPECFLERSGERLVSRPIKGTAARQSDPAADSAAAERLRTDVKERAENVMITDLVRNDLSRVAQPMSVEVDELCGIHSFANVHQMVSTVSCSVREDASWSDIMRATFPMGSMTGAPKLRAMEITAEVEPVERGLYSGTIGWAEPDGRGGVGDFHLNVVIRTLIADLVEGEWSAHVGGAITALAEAEAEWEETCLKAQALLEVLAEGVHDENPDANVLESDAHG